MKSTFIIDQNKSLIEALTLINDNNESCRTLFVLDDKKRMVGALTDGDIRRFLIEKKNLNYLVCDAMNKDFVSISEESEDIINQFHELRKLNIKLIPVLNAEKRIVKTINLDFIKSILPIDAVLMAGGRGERLRPFTEKIPKPLLLVGKKSIIDHNIDRLISFGIEHISVTVNYLKEQLEEHFLEPKQGVKVQTVSEPKFLGTMGSIQFIDTFHNDTILVMNSDLFTDIDYEDFYLHFKQHDADMSVAAVPYTVSVPYGIMDLDGRNIKGMIEKPRYNYYANAGIYLIKKEMLKFIPDGDFYNATDLIDDLIKSSYKVIRYPINGTWIDIGNPQEYAKAKDLVSHMRY